MKIKYFQDTDTLLIELSDEIVEETREISEDLYIDFDKKGNPVSITVEHAKQKVNILELSYLRVEQPVSN